MAFIYRYFLVVIVLVFHSIMHSDAGMAAANRHNLPRRVYYCVWCVCGVLMGVARQSKDRRWLVAYGSISSSGRFAGRRCRRRLLPIQYDAVKCTLNKTKIVYNLMICWETKISRRGGDECVWRLVAIFTIALADDCIFAYIYRKCVEEKMLFFCCSSKCSKWIMKVFYCALFMRSKEQKFGLMAIHYLFLVCAESLFSH